MQKSDLNYGISELCDLIIREPLNVWIKLYIGPRCYDIFMRENQKLAFTN
jgi:hypothetical protein